MNHGDLKQDLINKFVMIDGMTDEMIAETIDKDFLHNKLSNHHHQHQNDGQKEILKQQAIGEQLKRNVLIRKL